MSAALLTLAFALLVVAAAVDLIGGVTDRRVRVAPYLLAAVASAALLVIGARAVFGGPATLGGDLLATGRSALRIDPLAGLFLTGTAAVAVCVSLVFVSWVGPPGRSRGRGLAAGYALLLVAVAGVILAADAFVFLFSYELLTVSFYLLTAVERSEHEHVPGSFLTVAFGKLSGALLLVGFLALAGAAHSVAFAQWASVPPGTLRSAAYALIVLGFGAKVGLVPLQIWMPSGYAEAAGPARAAMSGIAMNVGLYGLWRVLGVLGRPPLWLAVVVLVAAAATALLGIAHAATNSDLNRVIAYSSVENGGLILTGYGVALAGAALHLPQLLAVGLLAATLQATSHALAKAAMFSASATIGSAYGTTALDQIRGAGRRLPYSGAAFAVGSLTLAGLPPTIGFASEWFLLEALIQQFRVAPLAVHLAMSTAGALLALTAGFAALTFVRLVGLTILGAQRDEPADHAAELGPVGRVGLVGLIAGCLALAAVAPLTIRFIARGLAPVVPPGVTLGALAQPWVLTPVYRDFSVLSPSWLWVTLPIGLTALFGIVFVASRGRLLRVRRLPPWRSGTAGVAGRDRFTSSAFATPTRHVLANVLHSRHELRVLDRDPTDAHLAYTSDVVEVTDRYLYRPLLAGLLRLVRFVKRLQSGRLDAYVGYLLLAVVAMLALVLAQR